MSELTKVITRAAQRYRKIAPDGLEWSREKEFAMELLRQNPKLRESEPKSLQAAMLQSASMGLSLNPALHLCYLIPRRARKPRRGEDAGNIPIIAYASPSYMGLVKIATDTGCLRWAAAEVVHENDRFRYFGPGQMPEFEMARRNRGQPEGVFTLARQSDGSVIASWMDREQIERARKASDLPDSAMWTTFWTEGWKKTALRRASKLWPKSEQLAAALAVMDQYEAGLNETEQPQGKDGGELLINEAQLTELHALCTDFDADPERWLGRLARRYGVTDIATLPADRFEEARTILRQGLGRKAS